MRSIARPAAANAVTYPLHPFIDVTAHAGIRTTSSEIQRLRRVPRTFANARK
jgi:hypothetical protein